MPRFMHMLLPKTLKYRLFVSFILLVMLPLSVLQIRNFTQIEDNIKSKIGRQNKEQLEFIKNSLESVRSSALTGMIQLEQDGDIRGIMLKQGLNDMEQNERIIQGKFTTIKGYFPAASANVYISIADQNGNSYHSFAPMKTSDRLSEEVNKLRQVEGEAMLWRVHPRNIVPAELSRSDSLYSLYSIVKDEYGHTVFTIRLSLDLEEWLKWGAAFSSVRQSLYLVDSEYTRLFQLNQGMAMPGSELLKAAVTASRSNGYFVDDNNTFLMNGVSLPTIGWYIVGQISLENFFGDIGQMKRELLMYYMLITIFFVGINLFLLSGLTKPLRKLQSSMTEMVARKLNIHIPEKGHQGESLALVRAFNKMVGDTQELIGRLKVEERQKEALKSQMLLSQMNPHFLMNTLNTIKWSIINNENKGAEQICTALGKLLESSLKSDTELLHWKSEREFVQAYIQIQTYRFANSFIVVYECEPELNYALVPKFSLQPLVENAISHGLVHTRSGGQITIRVYKNDDSLVMEVEDNGIGFEEASRIQSKRGRKGIALDNLNERLRLLFRSAGRLELVVLERGTLVRLTMPCLISNPYVKEEDGYVDNSISRG